MDLREAKRLISGGESGSVEFKRKIKFPEKVIKELVAFANTDGGYLFVGVSDDGSIPGVKYPEDEIYALNTTLESLCRPKLTYNEEIISIDENNYLVAYRVLPSDRKPHYVIDKQTGKKDQAYVRVKDKSIKASQQVREIIERKRKSKNIQFNYGEKEKLLMDYLDQHTHITLPKYQELASINHYQASRGLILLTLAGVLDVSPSDKEDMYSLKHHQGRMENGSD